MNTYYNFTKRLVDFFVAFCVLIVLAPLLLIIAIILCFANNGKCLFFSSGEARKAW